MFLDLVCDYLSIFVSVFIREIGLKFSLCGLGISVIVAS